MKNRIDQTLALKQNVLNVFFTAGYPQVDSTVPILKSLQDAGADMIEIGMPFSDPLADGPTIQQSSKKALANGMSTQLLFKQLEGFRENIHLPVILMGNINPVLQYGMEAFCKEASRLGIDGLLLPDLPPELYEVNYKSLFENYGLHAVFLVTPNTNSERLHYLDSLSGGFLYVVSSSATTGKQNGFGEETLTYFRKLKAMKLRNPLLAGFGISKAEDLEQVCAELDGGIVGSAYIRALSKSGNLQRTSMDFVNEIKGLTLKM